MTNPNSAAQAADPDFVTAELRGIIDVCEGSPTAVVSVERMRLWLSKLRAPVADERQAVAYLDLGTGGYMDMDTDLTDAELAALPKGRHMLAIIGTHGVNGYTPVSAPMADERAVETFAERFALALRPVAYTTKRGAVYLGKSTQVGSENLCTISQAVYEFRAALASAPVAGQAVALELRGVPETIKEGDGFWRSCTGCHELNEGRDTGPYSAVLGCHLGQGCSECGGIGAIWDSTDYQAMADDMARSMGQSVSAAPQASAEAFDFVAHLARQAEFSARTFGPGARVAGVCDHIRKELIEVETSGGDLKEWVDVIILGLDGAWRSGATPQEIIAAIVAKQAKNEARTWPDWRTVDPNKAIEHQRTAAPCTCPSGDGSLRHPCAAHPAKASGNGGQEWSDS